MNRSIALALVLMAAVTLASGYPLSGGEQTGIRRLAAARLAHEGVIPGQKRPPGELLSTAQVDLRLLEHPSLALPPPDPRFTAEIVRLLGERADRYAVAVLDLSDIGRPRYAEHRGDARSNPGSVGKLAVAAALFQALADIYPDDLERRKAVLRNTVITADEFIVYDDHKVGVWDSETRRLARRALQVGDAGTLWEFLDWMLSASSNAAASMVIQQTLLLLKYKEAYPVPVAEVGRFFGETPPGELRELLVEALQRPLERNGIDLREFRQGGFFTRTGKRRVAGTSSHATARGLMTFLLRLEQGRIVDPFSSREIKRLLYMTERRIRYASSPALRGAAVYFKSGSLYSCHPEPGFKCRKYHGNVTNLMNSVAVVESPAESRRLFYLVALTSNVLRRNSAVDHQTLATRIHRLIESHHRGRG